MSRSCNALPCLHEQGAALSSSPHSADDGGNATGGANRSRAISLGTLSAAVAQRVPFEPLHGTQLDVNFLSLALHNIAWVATALDFVWRAYRSVRLVIKYWGRASLGLPQIDLREDANSAASACTAAGRSPSKPKKSQKSSSPMEHGSSNTARRGRKHRRGGGHDDVDFQDNGNGAKHLQTQVSFEPRNPMSMDDEY